MKPSIGTVRRLQALGWCGWTRADIARVTGVHLTYEGRLVTDATAAAVARAYDLLSIMQPPDTFDNTQARRAARRLGWAPPLAWDEIAIDDPDAAPEGMNALRRLSIHEQVVELLAIGCSVTEIPSRVGARNLNAVIAAIRDPQLKAELRRRAS